MGSFMYKKIEPNNEIVLSYYIHFNEINLKNDVKFVEYNFNLNYENIYHHFFYNHMNIFIGITKNSLVVQAAIGEQCSERKELEPKMIVSDNGEEKEAAPIDSYAWPPFSSIAQES